MFYLIPLAGSWRKVADRNLQSGLVRQTLNFVIDVIFIDVDFFHLGDLLKDEVFLERQGRGTKDILLQEPLPGGDFFLRDAGRATAPPLDGA